MYRTDNSVILFRRVKDEYRNYEIGWFTIDTDDIPVNERGYESFCKSGCKNYGVNGGCPPYAPSFGKLRNKYSNGIVVWARMIQEHVPKVFYKPDLSYFLPMVYIQRTMPTITNYIRNKLIPLWEPDMYLGESKCKICGNQCGFMEEVKRCKYPLKRSFSLESTRIDVDLLMRIEAFPLHWFGRANKAIDVPYSVKVVMFLYEAEIPNRDFTKDIMKVFNGSKDYLAYSMEEVFR